MLNNIESPTVALSGLAVADMTFSDGARCGMAGAPADAMLSPRFICVNDGIACACAADNNAAVNKNARVILRYMRM
jgi:hypothetical protein